MQVAACIPDLQEEMKCTSMNAEVLKIRPGGHILPDLRARDFLGEWEHCIAGHCIAGQQIILGDVMRLAGNPVGCWVPDGGRRLREAWRASGLCLELLWTGVKHLFCFRIDHSPDACEIYL